jgi:hypothetical protein
VIIRQQFADFRHKSWREIAKERRAFARRVAADAVDGWVPLI